jgi:hypothetical protein
LEQVLKGGIDPGHPDQYRPTSALLKHLEGDDASGLSSGGFWGRRKTRLIHGITLATKP